MQSSDWPLQRLALALLPLLEVQFWGAVLALALFVSVIVSVGYENGIESARNAFLTLWWIPSVLVASVAGLGWANYHLRRQRRSISQTR